MAEKRYEIHLVGRDDLSSVFARAEQNARKFRKSVSEQAIAGPAVAPRFSEPEQQVRNKAAAALRFQREQERRQAIADERKALDAKLDELSAQIKHVQYALEFLASPVGVSSVKKWSERGRLSQARPAPKQAADAAKLLDAERAARKLDAQSRVEKYQKRHDEAEKSGNKTKAATYAELLDEAKADLVSLGV